MPPSMPAARWPGSPSRTWACWCVGTGWTTRVAKALAPMLRSDVIVVDDIGLLPVSEEAAEGLYRLVDAAYERRSVAISSNLHPSGFDELMPPSLATALVDRLLHHAHVVQTSGESIRLQDATSGKGVKPLTK